MTRRIHASVPVRAQFKGADLRGILRRLATKQESCRACGNPIGRSSRANLIAVLHRESRKKWPALLHPGCGHSAIYETGTAPQEDKVYFETECAIMIGERGPVPGLFIDAYGGYALLGSGEMHDALLAGFAQLGFTYPDWFDRGDGNAQPIDETQHTPGVNAVFREGTLLISHKGTELLRLNNLNYYPRWYRALHCGAVHVNIGRNLQGMSHESLEFIQQAASGKELISALAAVNVIPSEPSSSCRCVNGGTRSFGTCCGDPDGPEE